ncbi:MAG: ribulose-phosphate 3-epimerase, partial [Clostridia bacterium]|nr:ribulose-phosphate 3-epimerase [Clostridia bacterium]
LAGVSVKPGTKVQSVYPLLEKCDLVLVMSVEPGFGGQSYIDSATEKIRLLKNRIKRKGYKTLVSVDGGIDTKTAPVAAGAGADVLVAGSAVFGKGDIETAVENLRAAVKGLV